MTSKVNKQSKPKSTISVSKARSKDSKSAVEQKPVILEQAPIEPQDPVIPEAMTQEHLRQLEVGSAEVDKLKLQMHLNEQGLLNLRLQLKLLEHDIEKAKTLCTKAGVEYENAKKARNNIVKELRDIYKIEGSDFAYDPTSGIIKRP
jgi:hypothetical protein